MSEEKKPALPEISNAIHRQLAVELFNSTWDLIEKENRTEEDDLSMIHRAHASLYHWSLVGNPGNLAVGSWQVSHVYTILRHSDEAVYHADRCLAICEAHAIGEWSLAFAYEALARAHAAAGDSESARLHLAKAAELGRSITTEGDRNHFQSELAKGPWFGVELVSHAGGAGS